MIPGSHDARKDLDLPVLHLLKHSFIACFWYGLLILASSWSFTFRGWTLFIADFSSQDCALGGT